MKICIRKEESGLIYLDKTALSRFCEEELKQPPYNYSIIEIAENFSDCQSNDFNEDLTFSVEKYNTRKSKEQNAQKVEALKSKLTSTDYLAIKFAEGLLTAEEYAETKAQRQAWRNKINELEI